MNKEGSHLKEDARTQNNSSIAAELHQHHHQDQGSLKQAHLKIFLKNLSKTHSNPSSHVENV